MIQKTERDLFGHALADLPPYLTDKDLARLTPYKQATWQRYRCMDQKMAIQYRKGPPYVKINGRVYYRAADVVEWFADQAQTFIA